MTGNRLLRLGLLGIIAIGGAAAAGWFLLGPKSAAQALKSGEASYKAGVEALQEKKGSVAELRFQEAKIFADNAITRIDEDSRAKKNPNSEQMDEWTSQKGQAFYLKALAQRDEAFAKGFVDGKEIPVSTDTTNDTKFRSFVAVPDPKSRAEAITSLRNAAQFLPKNAEVQYDAVRAEASIHPITWQPAHRFSTALLELKPGDLRARYLVARHEFEQPQIGINQLTGPPKAPDKRSRSRVVDALGHIAKLKEAKDYPLGRTLFLEAQIRQWLATDYKSRSPVDLKKAAKELDALNTLLFDAQNGVLARVREGEGL